MARKARQRRPARPAQPASAGSQRERIFEAAMELAAERRWRDVRLVDIAVEAGIPLAAVAAEFPTKDAFVAELIRRADTAMLAGAEGAADEPVHDRLHDALMRRLDALKPYKGAVASIARDSAAPLDALCAGARLRRSMSLALESAGIGADGPFGRMRVNALTALYAGILVTWLRDDSEDSSRTMAALDRALRFVGGLSRCWPTGGWRVATPRA
jgi:AcrR family transcriptional regulator